MTKQHTLLEVMEHQISTFLESVHTTFPATIQTYNSSKREATIIPSVRLRMGQGQLVQLKPIPGVPVVFPCSSNFGLTFDLSPGDGVMIHCTEQAIGNWINSQLGTVVDPEDNSRFSLTDAIAVPGLYPSGRAPNPSTRIHGTKNSIEVKASNGTVSIDDSGLISIESPSGSVKDLLDDVWTETQGLTTDLLSWASPISSTGPVPVLGSAFSGIVAALTSRLVSISTKALKVQGVLK